jgi:glucokinase
LYDIYTWLRETSRLPEPAWLQERVNREDSSKVVSEVGLAGDDPVCEEALDMFVSLLAAAAGNLALTVLATGGMYLGGGIPPKILPRLEDELFMKAFAAKGRFEDLLKKVPVNVILNDEAALLGAAWCALDL